MGLLGRREEYVWRLDLTLLSLMTVGALTDRERSPYPLPLEILNLIRLETDRFEDSDAARFALPLGSSCYGKVRATVRVGSMSINILVGSADISLTTITLEITHENREFDEENGRGRSFFGLPQHND